VTSRPRRRAAIMQPYFVPYVGYFQLMAAVDVFVVYDDIKYTKKGWINRNRILVEGRDMYLTLPLRADSDALDVRERELADSFDPDKLLRRLDASYRKAPHFAETMPLCERIVRYPERNLFAFLWHSIGCIADHLAIDTSRVVSSSLGVDRGALGAERVIAICHALHADQYINPIGGVSLYSRQHFAAAGLRLDFLAPRELAYDQFGASFVPRLSILDVLMFNPLMTVREWIDRGYELT
jgi:hypothetical protein